MMKARITKAMEIRAQSKDTFRNTNGYSWDYVMVFAITPAANKLSPIQEEHNVKYILQHLADAGLQTKCFYSIQNDELYVKIRAPYGRLQREVSAPCAAGQDFLHPTACAVLADAHLLPASYPLSLLFAVIPRSLSCSTG